jgi:hypothetical protein
MCTSSAELETHSNDRVLGIGHVMVWTSHVVSEYCDLSFCLWLCPGWSNGYYHFLSYYRWFIYYHCYAFIWSWYIYLFLLLRPGEAGLAEYVCTHVFIVVFFSSSELRFWSRRLRVVGVHTQVVPRELAIFGRWFYSRNIQLV